MTFMLERNERRQLVLVDGGERIVDVEPVRAFPLSDPRRMISIVDSRGREVRFIESLDAIPEATRKVIESELALREFVPTLLRVVNAPEHTEPATWQVETDRGITTFELESEDSVHRRGPYRVSIVDSHGIRYEIPDTRKLDYHSKRVLDRFL